MIGGGRIDLVCDDAGLRVSCDRMREWVSISAHAVATYYGRFPVRSVTVKIASAPGVRSSIHGSTFGFKDSALIWIFVGTQTTDADLRDDWVMTHEMVHPFIHVKPLRTNTKEWVEGACDFLRLVVFDAVGMSTIADKRVRLYRSLAWKPGASFYHDHAGRLICWCQKLGVDYRRPSQLKKFLPKLWDTDLDATLGEPIK